MNCPYSHKDIIVKRLFWIWGV